MEAIVGVRRLATAFLFAMFASVAAGAPAGLIDGITAELRAYQQQNADSQGRGSKLTRDIIVRYVVPHFDFPALTTATLGHYWSELSDGERRCMTDGIRERLIERYTDYLVDFDYASIESTVAEPSSVPTIVYVQQTVATANPQPLVLRYKLGERDGRWLVTDLSVDGVGLAASYRTEFEEEIERDGLGDFLRTFPTCRNR